MGKGVRTREQRKVLLVGNEKAITVCIKFKCVHLCLLYLQDVFSICNVEGKLEVIDLLLRLVCAHKSERKL